MRYYIVDEDGTVSKTDSDEDALKMAEVATVIDKETDKLVCYDDTRMDIEELRQLEDEESDEPVTDAELVSGNAEDD